jgi:hypothetical protein
MTRRAPSLAAALLLALAPAAGRAGTFPTRSGQAGLVDVPTADTVGAGGGIIGGELRLDRVQGQSTSFGPLPLSIVVGLARALDVGFSMREWGRPGDPLPSPLLFGAAAKLRLVEGDGLVPGVALDGTLDRFNWQAVSTLRLVFSTADAGRFRLAAFGGAEVPGQRWGAYAPVAGAGLSLRVLRTTEAIVEATGGGRGTLLNGALRWSPTPRNALTLGVGWLPGESGMRVSLGFSLHGPAPAQKRARPVTPKAEDVLPAHDEEHPAPRPSAFLDERPRMRMIVREAGPPVPGLRRPRNDARVALAATVGRPAPQAAPSAALDADAAREQRLRAVEASLAGRGEELVALRREVEARRAAAEQQRAALDARERAVPAGIPGDREAMLAKSEVVALDAEARQRALERRAATAAQGAAGRAAAAARK